MAYLSRWLAGEGLDATALSVPVLEGSLDDFREYLLGDRGLTAAATRGYLDLVAPIVGDRVLGEDLTPPPWPCSAAPSPSPTPARTSRGPRSAQPPRGRSSASTPSGMTRTTGRSSMRTSGPSGR